MIESQEPAKACVIWLHGLGADASDMVGLAKHLPVINKALRHVFINAPQRPVTLNGGMVMSAWYDILGLELVDRSDKQGIEQSTLLIRQVMDTQLKDGIEFDKIILAGFSQGGAMALHTALNTPGRLAGVIALSAYLPLAADTHPVLSTATPIFIGAGQFDSMVLPKWTQASKEWLMSKGYENLSYNQYPMDHSICLEEINDIGVWLAKQIKEVMK